MANANTTSSQIEKILEAYRAGAMTDQEVHLRILSALEPLSLDKFLQLIPVEILSSLRQELATYPTAGKRWSEVFITHGGTFSNRPSVKEREAQRKREIELLRRGAETLRSYFATLPGPPSRG